MPNRDLLLLGDHPRDPALTRPAGKVITFYSYKGGTGRSMALANVAWILASNGKRVLAVDWDLEAPGLHRYFYPFLVDRELTTSDGLIDLFIDYATEAMTPAREDEVVASDWYLAHAGVDRYAASLNWRFPDKGTLDFIGAGRQGASYSARVNTFDWRAFYDRHGGGVFLEAVKERMRADYDFILVDSRTGVSDTAGICTVQMPDILVICFTLNNQSIEGASAVATVVSTQRRETPVRIFPVPMRIELAEKEKLEVRRQYARTRFSGFPAHLTGPPLDEYWGAIELLYVPYYAYEEQLVTFGDRPGHTSSLLAATERLVSYLTDGEVQRSTPPDEQKRQEILAAYARKAEETVLEDELDQAAERAFARLDVEAQVAAPRLLTRLVRLGRPDEGSTATRLRVSLHDAPDSSRQIVEPFLRERLLVLESDRSGGETVQLADEKLIQRWKRLRSWIETDREFLLWRQQLRGNIAEWENTKRDPSALLTGVPLQAAARWGDQRRPDLTTSEHAYIETSKRAAVTRRRGFAVAIVTVIAFGLAVTAVVWQWNRAADRRQEAASKISEANDFAGRGDLASALVRYDQALALNPTSAEAYFKRGDAYFRRGETKGGDRTAALEDYRRAIADYSRAIELRGDLVDTFVARALARARVDDYAGAIVDSMWAIALAPRDPALRFDLGVKLDVLGERDLAIASYSEAILLDPGLAQAYFNRALDYLAGGDKEEAAVDFKAILGLKADPRTEEAARIRLRQLGFTPRPRAAAAEVYVYSSTDPEEAPIVKRVAAVLTRKGFAVQGVEGRPEPTSGDVRYFYPEDEATATRLADAAETALAQEGFKVDLPVRLIHIKRLRAAPPPGTVEVWFPRLSTPTTSAFPSKG